MKLLAAFPATIGVDTNRKSYSVLTSVLKLTEYYRSDYRSTLLVFTRSWSGAYRRMPPLGPWAVQAIYHEIRPQQSTCPFRV